VTSNTLYIEDVDIGDEVPELVTSVSMDQVTAFLHLIPAPIIHQLPHLDSIVMNKQNKKGWMDRSSQVL